MPEYNLQDKKAVGIIDVQFSPLAAPMVAWYAWIDDDGDRVSAPRPVLGVIVRHEVNSAGEVIGSRVEMAVQFDETGELCVANDRVLVAENEAFVGIYPASANAPEGAISDAHDRIRRDLARKKKSG